MFHVSSNQMVDRYHRVRWACSDFFKVLTWRGERETRWQQARRMLGKVAQVGQALAAEKLGGTGGPSQPRSRFVWLDLGDFRELVTPHGSTEKWQDHGLGLLRTIMHREGILTDLRSTRTVSTWDEVRRDLRGYDTLLMNVRSYTFPMARRAAAIFKELNPKGMVLTGGMHASVAIGEMLEVAEFDRICQGAGEKSIVDLVTKPETFPRMFRGKSSGSMGEWPAIDRTLWPKPGSWMLRARYTWPHELECGWAPPPMATIITSRVCPWQCSFCNENSYIDNMERRPVDAVIEELNDIDRQYGLGSVVIHDSMFFQNPTWLREWLEKYPKRANRPWPYWAAARADTVRQWPELFEALVRETNWRTVSIGFESGSDRMLKLLNKECTEADNWFTIDLLNRIGDDLERQGKEAPKFYSNIMLAIPGETREDAFKTIRMLRGIKRVVPAISYYAPYPGSALGHQLIAEGKSLMSSDNYHRYANDKKVKGVDYAFYEDLLAGRYDEEVNRNLPEWQRTHTLRTAKSLHKA